MTIGITIGIAIIVLGVVLVVIGRRVHKKRVGKHFADQVKSGQQHVVISRDTMPDVEGAAAKLIGAGALMFVVGVLWALVAIVIRVIF